MNPTVPTMKPIESPTVKAIVTPTPTGTPTVDTQGASAENSAETTQNADTTKKATGFDNENVSWMESNRMILIVVVAFSAVVVCACCMLLCSYRKKRKNTAKMFEQLEVEQRDALQIDDVELMTTSHTTTKGGDNGIVDRFVNEASDNDNDELAVCIEGDDGIRNRRKGLVEKGDESPDSEE